MATVWVSTTTADVDTAADHPGEHWQRVGEIDMSAQRDFYTHIQQYLGTRQTAKGRPEFYLDGDPASEWVRAAKEDSAAQPPFWILLNPYGRSHPHYGSGSIKYLRGAARAVVVKDLARRRHEPHPGLQVEIVILAVKLKRRDGELFVPERTS